MDLLCVDELFTDDGSSNMIAAIDQTQLENAAADSAATLAAEDLAELLQKEEEGMPKRGYVSMYQQQQRDGDCIINVQQRDQAVAWMVDVSAKHGLSAQTVVRSITYLDRFLSKRPPRQQQEAKSNGKSKKNKKKRNNWWWLRLVQVSCLSLAIKLEETHMALPLPLLLELQRNEPLIFHGSSVARMELLVGSSLRWRMMTPTPLSFMSYFINQNQQHLHPKAEALVIAAMAAAVQLTEQRPSAVAAAAAIGLELELPLWLPNSIKKRAYQCCLIMAATNISHLQFGSHSHGDAQTVTVTAEPESPVAVLQLPSCSDSAFDDDDYSSCVCQSKSPQIHHPR